MSFLHRPHHFPLPLYREGEVGNSHGHFDSLTISRLWEMVGNGQNEREIWEMVGNGHFTIVQIFGKWSGNGQYLRSHNQLFSGNGGKWSNERDYA